MGRPGDRAPVGGEPAVVRRPRRGAPGDAGGAAMNVLLALLDRWRALRLRVGSWPSSAVIAALLATFAAWIVLDNHLLHFSGGVSRSTYDLMVRHRLVAAPPDPRVVVVDIDEASLARMSAEFGRWPWPRDTLATVLDHLEAQRPAAIVWDVLFSDPDRLSPGGDAAFDAAVARSRHSHFSVVRLPPRSDAASAITQEALPGLWARAPRPGSSAPVRTVALIPPCLPAVAASRLGLTNAHLDSDGVIRRAAAGETLGDGSLLQSLPLSVLRALQPEDWKARVAALDPAAPAPAALIAWRQGEQPYPHVAFADVFQQAEGHAPSQAVPPFAGRIVVIGATAPTLHDSHPTAVSPRQSGVDTLATLIDNELHRRHVAELPGWAQTLLAIALCATIAWLVRYRSLTLLDRYMLVLPTLLLGISYASLQTDAVFLDLYLATGWALLLMGVLARWVKWRRAHWCSMPPPALPGEPLALWPLWRPQGWSEMAVHGLIHLLERHGPQCRILLPGTPGSAGEWPEFGHFAALVGPFPAVQAARRELAPLLASPTAPLAAAGGPCLPLPASSGRATLVAAALQAWQALEADTRSDHERRNPEWTVAGQ